MPPRLARHYRDGEDLSIAEIACRLGRAQATVKAYLYNPISEKARGQGALYGPAPGQRAVRRSTARRASTRRASARSRQVDTKAAITDYLKKHPGSTAGDLAKGLNLQRNSVSTRLTQMAKAGEIKKATRGYEAR